MRRKRDVTPARGISHSLQIDVSHYLAAPNIYDLLRALGRKSESSKDARVLDENGMDVFSA